jgi:hypothetical protein
VSPVNRTAATVAESVSVRIHKDEVARLRIPPTRVQMIDTVRRLQANATARTFDATNHVAFGRRPTLPTFTGTFSTFSPTCLRTDANVADRKLNR